MADALADGFLYIYRRSVINVVVTNAGVHIHCCCQLLLLTMVTTTTDRAGEILGQFQQWLLSFSSHAWLICIAVIIIGNIVVIAIVHRVVVLLRVLLLFNVIDVIDNVVITIPNRLL